MSACSQDNKKFDVKKAVAGLGKVKEKDWTRNGIYSWAYRRHEALHKKSLDQEELKMQCRLVGQQVAADWFD